MRTPSFICRGPPGSAKWLRAGCCDGFGFRTFLRRSQVDAGLGSGGVCRRDHPRAERPQAPPPSSARKWNPPRPRLSRRLATLWLGALSASARRAPIGQQQAAAPTHAHCRRHHVLPRWAAPGSCRRARAAQSAPVPSGPRVRPWPPRPARPQAPMTVAAGSSAWQLHCRSAPGALPPAGARTPGSRRPSPAWRTMRGVGRPWPPLQRSVGP